MAAHPLATADALDGIVELLDRAEADRSELAPADRLALVAAARVVAGRIEALLCTLVAEAEDADAAMRAKATPLSSWLSVTGTLSRKEAAGLLHRARAVAGHEQVRTAAEAGAIGVGQARAIAGVLDGLPATLSGEQRERAETILVSMAERVDAEGLSRSAARVLAEVAPEDGAEAAARQLQRQAEIAFARRALSFVGDGQGSVLLRGSLPLADAEELRVLVEAYKEAARRTMLEEKDPLAQTLTPDQRRADALMALVRAHQVGALAPASGGDRPTVIVTLDYADLQRRAIEAGVLQPGVRLSGGDLRRLCCDAGLIPAVLGGPSAMLDVGRRNRFVTPELRAALVLRDGGCVFPGCDSPSSACEAHHIVPWWSGGVTSLANLVLLCHHHHALVEPARHGGRDQWQVRIAADGVPEFLQPRRMDAELRPVRHQRFILREVDARLGAPPGRGGDRPIGSRRPPPGRTVAAQSPPGRTVAAQSPPGWTVAAQSPPGQTAVAQSPPGGFAGDRCPRGTDNRGVRVRAPAGGLDLDAMGSSSER